MAGGANTYLWGGRVRKGMRPSSFWRAQEEEGEGRWVTIDGTHIFMSDTPSLTDTKGNKVKVEVSYRSLAEEGEVATLYDGYEVKAGGKIVGRMSLMDVPHRIDKGLLLYSLEGSQATKSGLKGAGTLLVARSVSESFKRGYNGKVVLYSLPKSRGFYEKLGFTKTKLTGELGAYKYDYEIGGVRARKLMQMARVKFGRL